MSTGKQLNCNVYLLRIPSMHLKKCVFFLKDRYDLVLVDRAGLIRGEYISDDREEVDRLLMELAILFKKY